MCRQDKEQLQRDQQWDIWNQVDNHYNGNFLRSFDKFPVDIPYIHLDPIHQQTTRHRRERTMSVQPVEMTGGKSLQHLEYEIPHYPKRFLPIRSKRFLISSKDFQRILMVTVSWLGKRTYTTLNYWNKPCFYNRIEKIFWLCDSLGSDDILFHIDCILSSL